jgi:hypothetical protein
MTSSSILSQTNEDGTHGVLPRPKGKIVLAVTASS